MTNPWLSWWEDLTLWFSVWRTPAVLKQLAGLAVILVVALLLDRILERYKAQWLGDAPPDRRRIRTVLWAAKWPVLVLVLGGVTVAAYSAADWPTRTLKRGVSFFWYGCAFALVNGGLKALMPASDARRWMRKVLLPLLAVVGILHLTGFLTTLWTWASQPIGSFASGAVSLANLWLALVIAGGFWLFARIGKVLFLKTVLPRTETDPALAHTVAGFVQFAIIVLGLWVAVDSLGIQFSNLTLLISALTVGIGFGLQDVIKNVMGGIILLGEGHVRPKEVFKIGGETGVVERIGIRSTALRTFDGSQVIVPNADLIAEKVVELTEACRVEVSVGVSCDADPRQAEQLLLEIAAAHQDIQSNPAPVVWFTNLGDSTFDFVLYCFVDDRSKVIPTRSDLHYAIVHTFRQHGLEMPYRQLDLHLRSGPWQRVTPTSDPT